MSALTIFEHAPIGAIVAWSDEMSRPPDRHSRKLAAWKTNNSQGRLIRKQGGRAGSALGASCSFTLDEADFGAGGVIAIRVHRTFSLASSLRFAIVERPPVASVRVFDRAGDHAELVHLAPHRAAAQHWLSRHGYPNAMLEDVTADEAAADAVEGTGGMNGMLSSSPSLPGTPDPSGVCFGRSSDGMPVALVDDHAYAMAPGRDRRHFLVYGWRIARPMAEWTRADFYGHAGELADEAAFHAKVAEQAEHVREKRRLGRRDIRGGAHTPWGVSQGGTVYAEGVTVHSTAGHGGFKLSAERNRKVFSVLRSAGGWYEEDAAWAIVAITFPHLFTAFERRCAENTVRDSWPGAWEAIFKTMLAPGESREKDRRAFEAEHAADWIVVSAITSDQVKGFVECAATPGGKRGAGTEERRFLVPAGEYEVGRFDFVIDPGRHAVYAGPSSFAGWQGRAP